MTGQTLLSRQSEKLSFFPKRLSGRTPVDLIEFVPVCTTAESLGLSPTNGTNAMVTQPHPLSSIEIRPLGYFCRNAFSVADGCMRAYFLSMYLFSWSDLYTGSNGMRHPSTECVRLKFHSLQWTEMKELLFSYKDCLPFTDSCFARVSLFSVSFLL